MNEEEKTVRWLNKRDPFHKWSVNEDVFCLHCDAVFKAQDVAQGQDDLPLCPLCRDGNPMDFAPIPWWREDLVEQSATRFRMVNTWRVEPIKAVAGKPGYLPPIPHNFENN